MKRFLRSKLFLPLFTFVMIAAAVTVPLTGHTVHTYAASNFQLTGKLWAYDAAVSNAPMRVWDLSTESLVTTLVPLNANGRGVAFDPTDGNLWISAVLYPGFTADGFIHKVSSSDGHEITTIPDPGGVNGPGIGALHYDSEENVLWAAAYQPVNGQSLFYKLNPSNGNILKTCSLPYQGGGEGNDTLAIARPADLGGAKVILSDAGEILPTLSAVDVNTCSVLKTYTLPAGVSGIDVDDTTGDLVATDLSTFYNFGPAPYNTTIGSFPTQGLVEGISLEHKPTTPPVQSLYDFKQTDNTHNPGGHWASDPLNNDPKNCLTMYYWGCAVTSIADVFNDYGKHYLPDNTTQLDPRSLNNWMALHGGFSVCDANWSKVANAIGIGVPQFLAYTAPNWGTKVTQIDTALKNGNFPILGIHPPTAKHPDDLHFIVLTQKVSDNPPDYKIADPALYPFVSNKPGNTGKSLSAAYGDFNTISRYVVIYDRHSSPQKSFSAVAHSPVQLLVTNPNGEQTGYQTTTNTYIQDIPESAYAPIGGIADVAGQQPAMNNTLYYQQADPSDGTYKIQVTGTGDGPYELDFAFNMPGQDPIIKSISGTATQGSVDTFVITLAPTGSQEISVTRIVQVDIKPGSDPAPINPAGNGVIPVAILSTSTFDATTIDPSTVKFGISGAASSQNSVEDVNGDGIPDLVLHFPTQQAGIKSGDTLACLTGTTRDGTNIQGCDTIVTVPH